MAAPVLPGLAAQLWAALGFAEDGPREWAVAPVFVPAGQDVSGLRDLRPSGGGPPPERSAARP